MAGRRDREKTVNKLKGRLQEATRHGYEEGAIMKILQKLVTVPMTLELLQLTHIGKEVNGLRKMEGEIGKTAKQLVRSWKQLLAGVNEGRGRGGEEVRERGGEGKGRGKRGTGEEGRVGEETSSVVHPHSSPPSLLTPPTVSSNRQTTYPVEEQGKSPVNGSTPVVGQRKRKAPVDRTVDAVAHIKKSRTQVYSGKKTCSGPQLVTSLFDMSMKILIDNIDAIEEVGGVPYLILEPLLQKCTVTQLLRLEEFNPHFLEDSDVLWQKHCVKDFKGCQPQEQQSWRQLYLSKLSDRELKLKNITANIRRREEARKEPVRQVKQLAVATRVPGRRRQPSSFPLSSRPSHFTLPSSAHGSKLRKQTMKMVKKRSQMAMSRPGKR